MQFTRTRYGLLTALLIGVALMLAGCGGDDGGLSTEDMARLTAAQEAADAAQEAADAAQETADAAQEEAHAAEQAAEAADMRAEMAEDAAEAADMRAADAEEALGTANEQIEDLQEQLDRQAEQEAEYSTDDPGGTREDAADRAAADRIYDSAVRAASQNQDADRRSNARTEPTGIMGGVSLATLEAARLGQAASLTIAVTGGPGLDSATADSVMTDMPMISGWQGVALSKAGPGAITQSALVYTEIERSVRAWGDVYRYNTVLGADGVPEPDGTTTPEVSRTHLLIGNAAQFTTALSSGTATLDHGLSTGTGVLTRTLTSGDTVRGSYGGVDGQYSFAGAATITLASDGSAVTVGVATVVAFRADDHETLLPDTDYLAFGVWEEVPDNPTLANPGRVRPFVKASAPAYTIADVDDLSGTATYSGNAVGHWATRAAGSHEAEQGRFTATASLTANFDAADSTVTPGTAGQTPDENTIASVTATGAVLTGQITGFMDESGEAMPGWLVNLNMGTMTPDMAAGNAVTTAAAGEDLITTRTNTANAEVDVLGTTSGTTGSLSFTGVWEAWMHGNNKDTYPTGVVGNFHADAGTPHPVATPEARIDLFRDEGFAGVVGSFAGR